MSTIEELSEQVQILKAQVDTLYLLLNTEDKWLTVQEACLELGVCKTTLLKYLKQGKVGIHYRQHGERAYRIHVNNFRKLLSGQTV